MARANYGSGSITAAGPGRWRLRWSSGVDPFTNEHIRRSETVNAATKTEARRMLADRVAARNTSRMTLGQLIDKCLPQLPVKDETRTTYGHALGNVPDLARKWVAADIKVTDARAVMEGLAQRHGAQYVRKTHAALMSVWRQATLNGWVTDFNPWRGQRLPKVPTSAGQPLTDDEIAALKNACMDDLERCWIHVHLATGARPGEVVALRWSDIDHDAKVVTVTDTKHDGQRRPVAIDAKTDAIIATWQRRQRERALADGVTLDGDPWLISNDEHSAKPWTSSYAGSFRWHKIRDRAGIRKELTLYDLRHTHNSWLGAGGIDQATRAERIGNSPATNLKVYSHSMRDREAAEVAAKRIYR